MLLHDSMVALLTLTYVNEIRENYKEESLLKRNFFFFKGKKINPKQQQNPNQDFQCKSSLNNSPSTSNVIEASGSLGRLW